MDNAIGNVAMMFNQYDVYNIKKPESGIDEFQPPTAGYRFFQKKNP